ncbi:hypothetical protein ScPMuIL_006826 [Solemya velum]
MEINNIWGTFSELIPKFNSVRLVFSIPYEVTRSDVRLAVIGSIPELGSWETSRCVLATRDPENPGVWRANARVSRLTHFEWKWVLLFADRGGVFRWEERINRQFTAGIRGGEIIAGWGADAEYKSGNPYNLSSYFEDDTTMCIFLLILGLAVYVLLK